LDQHALNPAPPLRQRGDHDVQGLEDHAVHARDINEEVLGILGDRGQLAVDDGREGEDLIFGIHYERVAIAALQNVAIAFALRVLFQDLLHAHLLAEIEWHEAPLRAFSEVAEGRTDPGDVVNPYGHLAAVPAQAPVQVLLQAHKRLDGLIGKGEPPHHGAAYDRPNTQHGLIHLQNDGPLLHRIFRQPGLKAQKAPHSPGHPFGAVEVRAVGEELHIHVLLFRPLSDICAHHGQPGHDRLF